jgi:hypothetical protein
MPHSLVGPSSWYYDEDGASTLHQNISNNLPDYVASHPRRHVNATVTAVTT